METVRRHPVAGCQVHHLMPVSRVAHRTAPGTLKSSTEWKSSGWPDSTARVMTDCSATLEAVAGLVSALRAADDRACHSTRQPDDALRIAQEAIA